AWLEIEDDQPIRYAIEPRAQSFEQSTALLRQHDVAMVCADTAGRFPRFDALTADFAYIRLHGASELYSSGYTAAELDEWAAVVNDTVRGIGAEPARDVYVYFDNDAQGHAPHDALALADRVPLGSVLE